MTITVSEAETQLQQVAAAEREHQHHVDSIRAQLAEFALSGSAPPPELQNSLAAARAMLEAMTEAKRLALQRIAEARATDTADAIAKDRLAVSAALRSRRKAAKEVSDLLRQLAEAVLELDRSERLLSFKIPAKSVLTEQGWLHSTTLAEVQEPRSLQHRIEKQLSRLLGSLWRNEHAGYGHFDIHDAMKNDEAEVLTVFDELRKPVRRTQEA